jgi:hypothetical protein
VLSVVVNAKPGTNSGLPALQDDGSGEDVLAFRRSLLLTSALAFLVQRMLQEFAANSHNAFCKLSVFAAVDK